MVSPLESLIRNAINEGFKGKLMPGTLERQFSPACGGLDKYGDVVAQSTETFTFNGIVETISAFYRASAGIPDSDVAVLIIAGSISTEPRIDDLVTIRGETFRVRKYLDRDPANASYRLQCYAPS